MDNLGTRKGLQVRELINGAGAELCFLPPDSPDLNLIENVLPQINAHLRKAAERNVVGLWDRIGEIIGVVSRKQTRSEFNAAKMHRTERVWLWRAYASAFARDAACAASPWQLGASNTTLFHPIRGSQCGRQR